MTASDGIFGSLAQPVTFGTRVLALSEELCLLENGALHQQRAKLLVDLNAFENLEQRQIYTSSPDYNELHFPKTVM